MPIPAAAIPAIISAVSSIASTIAQSQMAKKNARDANEFSAEQAELAYNRQLDFWSQQNEFNDPSAQLQRLTRAGLSPGHLAGGTPNLSAGGLSSVQSPQGVRADTPTFNFDFVTSLLQSAQFYKELEQTGLISEETKLMFQKVVSEKLSNELKRQLQAEGWSKLQIQAMDRVAKFRALYGDDAVIPRNPYFDESDLLQSIKRNPNVASYENVISDTILKNTNIDTQILLRGVQIANLEADAKLKLSQSQLNSVMSNFKSIESDILDIYGRHKAKAEARLTSAQTQEFINNTSLRKRLLEANVEEGEADALLRGFSVVLKSALVDPENEDYGTIEALARAFFNQFLDFE